MYSVSMVSKSTVAIFVLVFAVLGLLLGYAEATSNGTSESVDLSENLVPNDESEGAEAEGQDLESG